MQKIITWIRTLYPRAKSAFWFGVLKAMEVRIPTLVQEDALPWLRNRGREEQAREAVAVFQEMALQLALGSKRTDLWLMNNLAARLARELPPTPEMLMRVKG